MKIPTIGFALFLLVTTLLLVSHHHCHHVLAQTSTCQFTTNAFYRFNETRACLESIAFDNQLRQKTLDTISKTIPLYVFKDIARQSPDPNIVLSVNIEQGIKNLVQQESFANDYEFQHSVVNLFRSLNDGHTLYFAPSCYGNLFFKQPFNLISHEAGMTAADVKQQVISIASVNEPLAYFLQTEFGIDVRQYIGDQVVQIDDQEAVQSLIQFSNTSVGGYKDLGTRFNVAISGLFMSRQQNRNGMPTKESMTYVLKKSDGSQVTIDLPWIGVSQVNYTDANDFHSSCMSQLNVHQGFASPAEQKRYEVDNWDHLKHIEAVQAAANANNNIKQLVKGEKISYYEINGNVGVITIADFGPSSIPQFAKDFQTSLYFAKLNKISNMIIDLTNNGGGEECLGYALVKYLYSNSFKEDYVTLFANSDMIQSDLGLELAKAGAQKQVSDNIWSPLHWRSTNGGVFRDESWYSKSVEHTRGGVSNKYTSFVKENYCASFFSPFYFDDGSLLNYPLDDIILISNGRCASTCALFSRHLQDSRKVKTVVVGGITGLHQQIAQVPGGQVYEFEELMDDINRYNLQSSPNAPSALLTKSRFRFTIREAYSWTKGHTNSPLEFFFEGSDFRLQYSEKSAVDPTQVWVDAIQFFTTCVESKECRVLNGVGYQECNTTTGQYLQTCRTASCYPGYGIHMGACLSCSTGFYNNGSTLECQACTCKPAHSEFAPSTLLTDDKCPYACISGYALSASNECVSISVPSGFVAIKKGLIAFISIAAIAFLVSTIVLGAVSAFLYFRKRSSEHTRLL